MSSRKKVPELETTNCETPPRLALRPKEAAASLGIGQRLLWSMTVSGQIPSLKLGRCTVYSVASLQGWLAEQAAKGGAR